MSQYNRKKSELTKLGIQDEGMVLAQSKRLGQFGEYHYTVAPSTKMSNKTQEERFQKITGGTNGRTFHPDQMDTLRERLQNQPKPHQQTDNEAIMAIQMDLLGTHFLEVCEKEGIDHTYLEKMFYPNFLPPYECAAEALQVDVPLVYSREKFSTLVNLCRLPLERCDFESASAKINTDEFIGLLYGMYLPLTLTHFYCTITGQKIVYTRQFIEEFSLHLLRDLHRIQKISGEKTERNPILCIDPLGKMGGLMNQLKLLPVPVVSVYSDPMVNPYILHIPQSHQEKMKPFPVQKMPIEDAIKKYEPSIVVMCDMQSNKDETAMVRRHGCVKEIFHTGVTDGFIDGNALETWGNTYYVDAKHKKRMQEKGYEKFQPLYAQEGWKRHSLDHLSRWTIHRLDNPLAMGFGTVTCWTRGAYNYSFEDKAKFLMRRLTKRI